MSEKLYYKMFRTVPVESYVWVEAPNPILYRDLRITPIDYLESIMPGWTCQGYNLRQPEEV